MNEIIFSLQWLKKSRTLHEFSLETSNFLLHLQEELPFFDNLHFARSNIPVYGTNTFKDYQPLMENIRSHVFDKELSYSKLSGDGLPSWEATCPLGFTAFFKNKTPAHEEIEIVICDGIYDEYAGKNSIIISLKSATGLLDSFSSLKNIFLYLLNHWQADIGKVYPQGFSRRIAGQGISNIGWLTWLPTLTPAQVPTPADLLGMGIRWEAMHGGTLFILDEQMVSADNPEHVARGRLLRSRLMACGAIEN